MSGKGSAPRPFSVTNEEYASRWDAIFQRDLSKSDEHAQETAEVIQDASVIRQAFEKDEENERIPESK